MNYNFETNIEKRMPDNGKVFYVDRMTSDYAQEHPFDLDEFIEQVFTEFANTEYEENRDDMRRIWTAVLSVTSPCGDPSLYPNNNGHHPALMKVWHKAGDFWRSGFRTGDQLPAVVPGWKITRFENGEWIALAPKDMNLLDGSTEQESTADSIDNIEPVNNQCSTQPALSADSGSVASPKPVELDMFALMQMEVDRLRQENDRLRQQTERNTRESANRSTKRQPFSAGSGSVAAQSPTPQRAVACESDGLPDWCKYLGITFATVVALILIYKTGLMIPLGLIGLGLSGLAK